MPRPKPSSRSQKSSRSARVTRPTKPNRRSAFDRKKQQLDNEQEKLHAQVQEMQRMLEEAPKKEAARLREKQEELVRHAGERVIRLDAVAGTPSAVSPTTRRPRRKTKAQKQAEFAQLLVLAIICAGLVFIAIQLFL